MLKSILLASAIAFTIPAGSALAHDNGDWWGDQAEHDSFHDDLDAAHEAAHERGFWSPGEHAAYHRALRDMHREFHYDHPDAYNDIPPPSRRYPRWYSRPYYGYGYAPSYGYRPYYGSGWSFSFGGGW